MIIVSVLGEVSWYPEGMNVLGEIWLNSRFSALPLCVLLITTSL